MWLIHTASHYWACVSLVPQENELQHLVETHKRRDEYSYLFFVFTMIRNGITCVYEHNRPHSLRSPFDRGLLQGTIKALPLENRRQRTVVFTAVDNVAEMSYLLIVTINVHLQLRNCRGTGGEFKGGNVTLTNPFDTDLARRLSDCSKRGLSSHQMSCRTFKMTVSCSFAFSAAVLQTRGIS